MLNRKMIVMGVIGVLILFFGIGLLINNYIINKEENIAIYTAPKTANVKLGDNTIQADTPMHISPGTYPLSITANNFTSIKQTVTVTDKFKSLVFCLKPTNMDQVEYFKAHPDDEYTCEGAAGQTYNQDVKAAIKKYPIIAQLPYEDGTFSIGQGPTKGSNEPSVYIHYSTDRSKAEALDWIHRYQTRGLPSIVYINDYTQTERIGGKDSPIDTILTEKYPIVTSLPIDAYIYKLGYRIDESDRSGYSIKLTVTSDTPSGRIAALREIHSLGYSPINYKIEFINFESDIR